MNSSTVLFIVSGILWMVIGVGLGMLLESYKSPQRRRVALETGIIERRAELNDVLVMVSPAWRLHVRDAEGASRYAHVEDRGDPLPALIERACDNLAVQTRVTPRPPRPPATPPAPSFPPLPSELPKVLVPERSEP